MVRVGVVGGGYCVVERVFWVVPFFAEHVFRWLSLGDIIVCGRVSSLFRVLVERYLSRRGRMSVLLDGRVRDGVGFNGMLRRTGAVLSGSLVMEYILCPGVSPVGELLLFIDCRSESLWRDWLSVAEEAVGFDRRFSFSLWRYVVEVRGADGRLVLIYVPLGRRELVYSFTSVFEYWNVMGCGYLCSAYLRRRLGESLVGGGRFLFRDGCRRRCVSARDQGIVCM